MKEVIYFSLSLMILFMSVGCEHEESDISVTMADGKNFVVSKTIKYYSTEEEFVHNVSFSFPCTYNYEVVDSIDYQLDKQYETTGYNQTFTGCWEMAKLGDWSKKYGLSPNEIYYVATNIFAKYVQQPQNGLAIVPHLGKENMGYSPDIEPTTFRVTTDSNNKICILKTGCRVIGYDSNKRSVDCNLPNLKNRKVWRFLIQSDGWD